MTSLQPKFMLLLVVYLRLSTSTYINADYPLDWLLMARKQTSKYVCVYVCMYLVGKYALLAGKSLVETGRNT